MNALRFPPSSSMGCWAAALLGAALLSLAMSPKAAAQNSGRIAGTVTSASGETLPGVTVSVHRERGGETLTGGATGEDGTYVIENVEPGPYVLEVSFVGLAPQQQAVTVEAGQTTTADFTLEEDPLQMQEVVVSGTFNPASKLESSVAISTIDAAEIERKAPASTADLYRSIPGLWVDAGTQVGVTVTPRGLPGGQGFAYSKIMEDGLPVLDDYFFPYPIQDLFARTDKTIERVEAIRGGSASIFASSAPGAILNHISKTGGKTLSGTAQFEGTTKSSLRGDLNIGGPLGEDWRFNVGGFYRTGDGYRNPGYHPDQGGQVKANVTRLFDSGYVRLYGKYLDDNVKWEGQAPFKFGDDGEPTAIDGFDAGEATLYSPSLATYQFIDPERSSPGNPVYSERSVQDGLDVNDFYLGAEVDLDLGKGWQFNNKARVNRAVSKYEAEFNTLPPFDADTLAKNIRDNVLSNLGAPPALQGQLAALVTPEYQYAGTDDALDPETLGGGNGLATIMVVNGTDDEITSVINQLEITKSFERHDVSLGVYGSYLSKKTDQLAHTVIKEVSDTPRLLDLQFNLDPSLQPLLPGLIPPEQLPPPDERGAVEITQNGFLQYGQLYQNTDGTDFIGAVYGGDQWQATDDLRLDLGARLERKLIDVDREGARNVAPAAGGYDGNALTAFDNTLTAGNDTTTNYHETFFDWAASLGVNYTFTDHFAGFARASRGYVSIPMNAYAINSVAQTIGPADEDGRAVYQAELGAKYQNPKLSVFVNGIYARVNNFLTSVQVTNPATGNIVGTQATAESRTFAGEAEVVLLPFAGSGTAAEGLRLKLHATAQNAQFADFPVTLPDPADQVPDDEETRQLKGNDVPNTPGFLLGVSPSYTLGPVSVFGTYRYSGSRQANYLNTFEYPGYSELSAGASLTVRGVRLTARGSNLTNAVGFLGGAGNPSNFVTPEPGSYQIARTTLPRTFTLSLAYLF